MTDTQSPVAGTRTLTVTLAIDPAGGVSVLGRGSSGIEAALFEAAKKKKPKPPPFDVPFNAKYDDRSGFADDFLLPAQVKVPVPAMSSALTLVATKLIAPPAGADPHLLHYHNYSVVMHSQRRFAIYSAANVDFAGRYEMSRPTDVWREDPRIPLDSQVTNFYYAGNQFDRGHLTRREDLEFGSSRKKALQSAADTCHWTNCTPQHSRFNQSKELWQGIERHVLEEAIETNNFRAQVFTGPVLQEDDPVWEKFKAIQYPTRFWKVVAALNGSGDLFATAYVLDQSEVIDQFGIEAAPEVPFGAYKTFQVPIKEVERLTQLSFTASTAAGGPKPLSAFDPLDKGPRSRGRRRSRMTPREAMELDVPEDYVYLDTLEAIQT